MKTWQRDEDRMQAADLRTSTTLYGPLRRQGSELGYEAGIAAYRESSNNTVEELMLFYLEAPRYRPRTCTPTIIAEWQAMFWLPVGRASFSRMRNHRVSLSQVSRGRMLLSIKEGKISMASGSYVQRPLSEAKMRPLQGHAGRMKPGGFWSKRRELCLSVAGLFLVVVIGSGLLQHPTSLSLFPSIQSYDMQVGGQEANTWQHPVDLANPNVNTRGATVRLNQTDEQQYLSADQYNAWSQSACSAAAIATVINTYGHTYRIGTLLEVSIALKAISQTQGLLSPDGIDQTAYRFGFETETLAHPTLQQVLDVANGGKPVLINFPPKAGTVWAGGHFLVVKGGTVDAIELADSSAVNGGKGLQTVDQNYMSQYWRGFAKVLKPSSSISSVISDTPTVSADFINKVLSHYKSPAVGKGQTLYDLGKQYGIDPTFALAFFMHESSFGTQGEATKSLSLGNLRCIPNYRCEENFAQFDSWEDGFKAWYQLIRNLYIAEWGLATVDQIIPRYAPSADNNNEAAYIAALKHAVSIWQSGQVVVK